jgi:hypothetical protein
LKGFNLLSAEDSNKPVIIHKGFSFDLMRGILNFLDAVEHISEPELGVAFRRLGSGQAQWGFESGHHRRGIPQIHGAI